MAATLACTKPTDDGRAPERANPAASIGGTATATQSSTVSTASGTKEVKDPRLLPLEVGREWTYRVETSYPNCRGKLTRVLSQRESDGAYEVLMPCATGFMRVKGNSVDTRGPGTGAWEHTLDDTLVEGHRWRTSNGSASYEYEYSAERTVQTPAGPFIGCWRVTQQVKYESYRIYCPGVGLVRYRLTDLFAGKVSMDLVAKNF